MRRTAVLTVGLFLTTAYAPGAEPAAGFFRVRDSDGNWFFIDPQNRPFFSIGINCINPADDDVPGPKYNGLARHGGDLEKWRRKTLERLRSWNVNTIGAWSSLRGMPYVLELSLSYAWADVFDDDFENYVRQAALDVLKRPDVAADYETLARDPLLIGYFTDNELPWGWGYEWSGNENELSLFEYYATLKPESAGKQAWAAYLAETYNQDWNRLSRVWNVMAARRADLLDATKIAPRSPQHRVEARRVADGFLKRIAERYFDVTNRVMRGHLPRHLNLGCRMTPGFPPVVAEVAGRYADVMSFNIYERGPARIVEELTRLHKASGKPVMLTEFSFPARKNRSGNTNAGYERATVRDDRERGEHYARCLDALAELPFVVGCHWFQYYDEPTQGRSDGENCNFGFVDVQDRVYEDLSRAAAAANHRAISRRTRAFPGTRLKSSHRCGMSARASALPDGGRSLCWGFGNGGGQHGDSGAVSGMCVGDPGGREARGPAGEVSEVWGDDSGARAGRGHVRFPAPAPARPRER
ncbi:MAG TPA: hypothetical protein VML55_00445 [Planctomycetaceae bacterium]|nr:hypothetical protein [Planctomycetaceae bacterium]